MREEIIPRPREKPLEVEDGLADVCLHVRKYSVLGSNWQEENFDDNNKPTDAWKHIRRAW